MGSSPAPYNASMWHWLSDHGPVFGDIMLVWLAPVLAVGLMSRLFQRGVGATAVDRTPAAPRRSPDDINRRTAA